MNANASKQIQCAELGLRAPVFVLSVSFVVAKLIKPSYHPRTDSMFYVFSCLFIVHYGIIWGNSSTFRGVVFYVVCCGQAGA